MNLKYSLLLLKAKSIELEVEIVPKIIFQNSLAFWWVVITAQSLFIVSDPNFLILKQWVEVCFGIGHLCI